VCIPLLKFCRAFQCHRATTVAVSLEFLRLNEEEGKKKGRTSLRSKGEDGEGERRGRRRRSRRSPPARPLAATTRGQIMSSTQATKAANQAAAMQPQAPVKGGAASLDRRKSNLFLLPTSGRSVRVAWALPPPTTAKRYSSSASFFLQRRYQLPRLLRRRSGRRLPTDVTEATAALFP
jgi:hypothetical protein